jgi:hypothetical protein
MRNQKRIRTLHVSIGERDSGINHVIETIVVVFFHITFLNACCQCRIEGGEREEQKY